MDTVSFIDHNQKQQTIAIDQIEDIFGFNSLEQQGRLYWFFWICTKSDKVMKSQAYESLTLAREAYSALKLKFEQARLAS